jgi:microcompartment protein CcmK/EutM
MLITLEEHSMKNLAAIFLFVLSFQAFATDSKECNSRQVVNYEVSADIIDAKNSNNMVYLNSGSARKLYLRMETPAVDSRTLGTIEQDVTGHFTKKGKGITCFKQEVETQECAIYSCNMRLMTEVPQEKNR